MIAGGAGNGVADTHYDESDWNILYRLNVARKSKKQLSSWGVWRIGGVGEGF